MNVVQYTWWRQSRTEYMAAALTSQMTHWMIAVGLSPSMLKRATQVVADEVDHAAICHALYLHVGGDAEQVEIKQSMLVHADDPDAPINLRTISAAAGLACEESVALTVFRARLRNATDPLARETVATILRDEATHRAFAWDLLDELVDRLGHDTVHTWARPRIAWWLRIYLMARLRPEEPTFTPEQLAFGLIDRREHWTMMRETVEDTVIPRFIERGLLAAGTTGDELESELVVRNDKVVAPWRLQPAAAPHATM